MRHEIIEPEIVNDKVLSVITYPSEIEQKMQRFFATLSEKDRRRYAAIEASKLSHGGIDYIGKLLTIDPKTIRVGAAELELAEDPVPKRIRKKAVVAKS